jgi:hypothetical protein
LNSRSILRSRRAAHASIASVLIGLRGHGKLATELGVALTGKVGGRIAAWASADPPAAPIRTTSQTMRWRTSPVSQALSCLAQASGPPTALMPPRASRACLTQLPLGRAHAHHRALHLVVLAAAALAHVRGAHVVPDLLGLDQHAVQVEDDGLDHSFRSRRRPSRRLRSLVSSVEPTLTTSGMSGLDTSARSARARARPTRPRR